MSEAFSQIGSKTQMYSKEKVDRITKYPGEPMFTFSAISDIHLRVEDSTNDDAGHDDLKNLFKVLGNRQRDMGLNLKYIFCAGDIGYDSKIGEIRAFNNIVTNHCPISFDNVFSCNGNHDRGHSIDDWKNHMFSESNQLDVTDEKNFTHTDGNFVFAFMSLRQDAPSPNRSDLYTQYYFSETSETEEWLRGVVADSAGKTLILFMHYPFINRKCFDINKTDLVIYDFETDADILQSIPTAELNIPYAGLADGGGNGDKSYSMVTYHGWRVDPSDSFDYENPTEWERIIEILKGHQGGKTIVFSGHTHFAFECEDYNQIWGKGYANINVAPIVDFDASTRKYTDTGITTVHIPSLNYPRQFKGSSSTFPGAVTGYSTISGANPYRQPCQSWLVDVYEDKLILRGFESWVAHNKKYGDILDKYIYTIDLMASEEDVDNG